MRPSDRRRPGRARNLAWLTLLAVAALALGACAGMPHTDPLQVTVAGIEPLQGEGMELRLLVKLRVQNPNDSAFDFAGAYVELDVQGKTFATGVSDQAGSVPRFGETIVSVPVTVSVFRMVRHVMGVLDGQPVDKIDYVLEGKLSGSGLSTRRFQASGEFSLPRSTAATGAVASPDGTR